jgi:hypothetical protein
VLPPVAGLHAVSLRNRRDKNNRSRGAEPSAGRRGAGRDGTATGQGGA